MQKLKMRTPDFTDENIARIAQLFPDCITESRDESGTLKRAIDFDQLRQELFGSIVDGTAERYQLNWPGKREALLTANAPIAKTLRPCREDSVDFDTTRNLFVEGDNLDALKLLQETYLGKVKMIYIDPPYNTGNDFIYEDDFAENKDEYFERSLQKDARGNRLVSNPESNGRFHSDWLSMISPRLRLARNLMADSGVIFLSIDDGELARLRLLCDEVFGEQNFIAQLIWKKRSTPPNDKVVGTQHDYILIYCKDASSVELNLRERSQRQVERYKNPDNHPKGPWAASDLTANVKGGRFVESLHFEIINPNTGEAHFPSANGNWRFNKERIEKLLSNNEIYFGSDGRGKPMLKRFLCDIKEGITWTTIWDFVPLNTEGSQEMRELLGSSTVFENPKPTGLITHLVKVGMGSDGIILDYFSGSSTTAHAVIQLNSEDRGNRRFILVQLPEETDEQSEAYKAGYKTIAELGKERIRRAGQKIREEAELNGANLDIGFRVLKIHTSNMKDVYYSPDEQSQANLLDQIANVKEGRSSEDLLFQVLLDWGVDLASRIVFEKICDKEVFFVDENALAACFDVDLNENFVKELAKRKPLRAVFRDAGFASDDIKINVEQIFKLMSPETEVRSI